MMPALELGSEPSHDVLTESALLGRLAVPRGQLYLFERGIYGFPEARTFALLPAERPGFFWLQSIENPSLTFLLVDPFRFVDDYAVELSGRDLDELTPRVETDLLVLAIVTLPMGPTSTTTLNLQGPLAFNVSRMRGKQLVVESRHGVRYPVDLSGSGSAARP